MLRLAAGSADLAFVDTETTGLEDYDHVWEIAVVRCRPDGKLRQQLYTQVRHKGYLAAGLPPEFQADHAARYDESLAVTPARAAEVVREILAGTTLVGVNPAFDSRMLSQLVEGQGYSVTWDYRVIDLAAMSLAALARTDTPVKLPWRSDDLARAVGVPDTDLLGDPMWDRHTALGDVEWSMAWWHALTGIEPHAGKREWVTRIASKLLEGSGRWGLEEDG